MNITQKILDFLKNHLITVALIVITCSFFAFLVMALVPAWEKYIEISLNAILAFVTTVYVLLTAVILADSHKSRQIDFMKDRLEKFYYPIRSMLKPSVYCDNFVTDANVYPYQYLATEKTREAFLRLADYDNHTKDNRPTHKELSELVESDIETILDELNKLLK